MARQWKAAVVQELQEIQVLGTYEYGYCRAIVKGVSRLRRAHSGYQLRFTDLNYNYDFSLMEGKGIGLVVMAGTLELQREIAKHGIPAVNISGRVENPILPTVVPDNVAVGRMAAEHLLDTGVMHFVYFGMQGNHFSDLRGAGFRAAIEARGFECREFVGSPEELAQGPKGLKSMPRPLGLFLPTDRMASRTLHYLKWTGMRVPEDVAVVGVDNDDIECSISTPPLSSVDCAAERVGYEAAALLERIAGGEKAPKKPVLIQPIGVVARESTDLLAVSDPDLSAVLRYIRDHATEHLTVADVLERSPVSRRSLEMRFRKRFGRSMLQEITRVKLRRAQYLLCTTDQKLAAISASVGFTRLRGFQTAFVAATGESPSQFRNRLRYMGEVGSGEG